MGEYKARTGDDVCVEFWQRTARTSKRSNRFKIATNCQMMTTLPEKRNISTQVEDSGSYNSTEATTILPTTSSPSQRSKTKRKDNENICSLCHIRYGSKMDEVYGSIWISCSSSRCHTSIHAKCIGIVVKDKDVDKFSESFSFFCTKHKPKGPRQPTKRQLDISS